MKYTVIALLASLTALTSFGDSIVLTHANPALSYGADQVVAMHNAGAPADAIERFIRGQAAPFNLDRAQATILLNAGVSVDQMKAMVAHDKAIVDNARAFAAYHAAAVSAHAAPAPAQTSDSYAAAGSAPTPSPAAYSYYGSIGGAAIVSRHKTADNSVFRMVDDYRGRSAGRSIPTRR